MGSVIIGYGVVSDLHWLDGEDRSQFGHTVPPDHEGLVVDRKSTHDYVERYVPGLISDRQVKQVKVGWLTDNGYRAVRRFPSSSLDVAAFDFGKWEVCIENVEASGIEFLSRAYLQAHNPDWHANLQEAWVEIKGTHIE